MECHRIHSAKTFAKRALRDVEWMKERSRKSNAWKAENPEKKRVTAAEWRAKNPKKLMGYRESFYKKVGASYYYQANKRLRAADPAKARQAVKDWESRNPERAKEVRRATIINRRTRKAKNGGTCTAQDIKELYVRFNGKCAVCASVSNIHIDHVMPIARGGSCSPSNLQLLCRTCNSAKGSRGPLEWAASINRPDLVEGIKHEHIDLSYNSAS